MRKRWLAMPSTTVATGTSWGRFWKTRPSTPDWLQVGTTNDRRSYPPCSLSRDCIDECSAVWWPLRHSPSTCLGINSKPFQCHQRMQHPRLINRRTFFNSTYNSSTASSICSNNSQKISCTSNNSCLRSESDEHVPRSQTWVAWRAWYFVAM